MVVFGKTSSPQLYAAPGGGPSGQDVWIAYYLPETPAQPPDSITLADALGPAYGGSFVFSCAPGMSIDAFASSIVAGVTAALAQPTFPGARAFVWLTQPRAITLATTLLLGLSNNGKAVNVALQAPMAPGVLSFNVNNGLAIAFDGDSVLTFSTPTPNGLGFVGSSAPRQTVIHSATLPFSGDSAGALGFAVELGRDDLLAKLGWGLQMLYADAGGAVRSQLYPLASGRLPSAADMLGFNVTLDPSDVVNRRLIDRSLFAFDGTTNGTAGVTLVSGFQTAWADTIQLTPVTAGDQGQIPAGLVLTLGNPNTAAGQQFAFAPRGDFVIDLSGPKSQSPQPLLCGLTPTETMTIAPGADRLRFSTNQPAWAASYPPQPASTLGPPVDTSAPLVTDLYLTSWATVVNAPGQTAGVHYAAQPKGQPLFGLDDVVTPKAGGTLGPVDPGYLLPPQPVPLMPYALAAPQGDPTGFTPGTVSDIEARVIAPVRRTGIGGPASTRTSVAAPHRRKALLSARGGSSMQATTPMGLVATVDAGGVWRSVDLGLNAEVGVGMRFIEPPPELQQALQSSELFLVAANADHLGALTGWDPAGSIQPAAEPPRFFNAMSIADWRIEAKVGQNKGYGDYNDVLIVKGCRGKVADLVQKPDAWTQAGTFSIPSYRDGGGGDANDIVVLSTWLADYIAAAEARSGDPYFTNFLEIVHSDTWTGILVLKASLTKLPPDLGGLLATVDPAYTFAHHFGVTVSPVEAATVTVDKTSAMFELVYYVAPGFDDAADNLQPMPPSTPGPYDFQLLTMKALFENSAVANFDSRAQLTLGEWFSDAVTSMGAGGNTFNTIFLTGSYQSQNGKSGYVLDSETSNQFNLASTIINKIEVVKALYTTVDDQHSRFDVWGFIDYALVGGEDAPFDIFSFGNLPGNDYDRTGLSFSALGLDMAVDSKQAKTFAFDASRIAFDLGQSTPRPGCIYSAFALRPPSIVVGAPGEDPLSLGYLSVATSTPLSGVDQKKPWYGLAFGLDMGSVGALAGSAGLSATMLAAWGPSSSRASVGGSWPARLAVALPGVNPTAKLLSLEGVLRLAIGELSLTYTPPQAGDPNAWVLSLMDIGMKFLGFLKIPPNGAINFTCFGNPGANVTPTSLGWYAVYNQDPPSGVSDRI
ncbi:hypothetical protein [Brevundimonas sp.]|uniref:hypothetical protein n=1 Tax=Brevundimonas sp. TaxID=1871086 RepID=UPI002FCA0818